MVHIGYKTGDRLIEAALRAAKNFGQ
ncbi:MAG: hypothetical protein JWQ16_1862, partial [Novosphingobium sp.]|nr:hypothetical protein [Novosphingobium sp.]